MAQADILPPGGDQVVRIAVDAMGGDNAPQAIVEGAVLAVEKGYVRPDEIILVGRREEIVRILENRKDFRSALEVLDAPEVVGMDESPVDALRKKRNSSIVRAISLVKDHAAEAIISAGNTGAVVAGSVFLLGMLKGIKRPGIGVLFHSQSGPKESPAQPVKAETLAGQEEDHAGRHGSGQVGKSGLVEQAGGAVRQAQEDLEVPGGQQQGDDCQDAKESRGGENPLAVGRAGLDQAMQTNAAQDGTPYHRDAQPQDRADAEPGDLAGIEE